MKTIIFAFAVTLLAGCAGQEEQEAPSTQDITQAVKDFIAVRDLEELEALRSGNNDGWSEISDTFIIYKGRRDEYLVEFARRCHELRDNTRITPDKRWDNNRVRARFDTIRGCRIAKIYALDDAEVAEIRNIGEAPGSRN